MLNGYSYALNNPLAVLDPSGAEPESAKPEKAESTDDKMKKFIEAVNSKLSSDDSTKELKLAMSSNKVTRERSGADQAEVALQTGSDGKNLMRTKTCKTQHYESTARDLLLFKGKNYQSNLSKLDKATREKIETIMNDEMVTHGLFTVRGDQSAKLDKFDPLHIQAEGRTKIDWMNPEVQSCLRHYKEARDAGLGSKNSRVEKELKHLKEPPPAPLP
jgi:hypothetical protein